MVIRDINNVIPSIMLDNTFAEESINTGELGLLRMEE